MNRDLKLSDWEVLQAFIPAMLVVVTVAVLLLIITHYNNNNKQEENEREGYTNIANNNISIDESI